MKERCPKNPDNYVFHTNFLFCFSLYTGLKLKNIFGKTLLSLKKIRSQQGTMIQNLRYYVFIAEDYLIILDLLNLKVTRKIRLKNIYKSGFFNQIFYEREDKNIYLFQYKTSYECNIICHKIGLTTLKQSKVKIKGKKIK